MNTGQNAATTVNPAVSVVIPAYNQAHYLTEAIESVLEQTYCHFELIVVDDGSTDATPTVAHRFGNKIRYFRQENQGLAGARNSGIRLACGHFVALLDSDDAWQLQYLEKMMALAREEPQAAVYYCGVSYMDSNGRDMPQKGSSRVVAPDEMYQVLLRGNFLVPSTILMRREAVAAVGLFDPDFRRLQDWELWLRLLRQGYTFAGLPERLVRYRLHDSSLSTDRGGGQRAAIALAEKHFGPDDGRWSSWTADKRRMYGGVYRYHALIASLIRAGDWDTCARYLRKSFEIDPTLVEDLDLFYELALGAQPIGQRGTSHRLELEKNEAQIIDVLEAVFRKPSVELASLRPRIYSLSFYALGLVAHNTGHIGASRRFFWQALRFWPTPRFIAQCTGALLKTLVRHSALRRLRLWLVWSKTSQTLACDDV